MSLQQEGYRYIHRLGRGFIWVPAAELLPSDIDCTDIGDNASTAYVESVQ